MQCNFRLQSFLELPEYSHPKQDDNGYPTGSVEIANASMAWEIITQGKNKNRKTDIGNPWLEEYFTNFYWLNVL